MFDVRYDASTQNDINHVIFEWLHWIDSKSTVQYVLYSTLSQEVVRWFRALYEYYVAQSIA